MHVGTQAMEETVKVQVEVHKQKYGAGRSAQLQWSMINEFGRKRWLGAMTCQPNRRPRFWRILSSVSWSFKPRLGRGFRRLGRGFRIRTAEHLSGEEWLIWAGFHLNSFCLILWMLQGPCRNVSMFRNNASTLPNQSYDIPTHETSHKQPPSTSSRYPQACSCASDTT